MKLNIEGVDLPLYKETLKNGLEIYILPNTNVKNYYITFSARFGSIDTEFKKDGESKYTKVPDGIAHFLEHLTFKMEDGDASDYFPTIGCSTNAFTNYDVTCYEVFGYKNFKEALTYLLDFVQTPFYNKKNVEAEKGIICEEIKMRDDIPFIRLQDAINKSLYKKDKRRNLISGTIKDVKETTLEDILACYNTFYHPSNMFLIITGNVNPEETLAIIEENQSKKNYTEKVTIKRKKQKEPFEVEESLVRTKGNIEIEKVAVSIKIPLSEFKDLKLSKELLSVYISMIINSNFGRSSMFRERLVSGNIITDGPYTSKTITQDYLVISIIVDTPYPERFISIAKESLKDISISEEELLRKKRVALSSFIMNFDNIESTNYNMLLDIIDYGTYDGDLYNIYKDLELSIAKKIVKKLITDNIAVNILEKKE